MYLVFPVFTAKPISLQVFNNTSIVHNNIENYGIPFRASECGLGFVYCFPLDTQCTVPCCETTGYTEPCGAECRLNK